MMRLDDLLAEISALRRGDLDIWIRRELVVAEAEGETLVFTEMECARVRLICTLHYDMEVDLDTLPLVLSLVDQLHDTRARLRSLSSAVAAQDAAVRTAILASLKGTAGAGPEPEV